MSKTNKIFQKTPVKIQNRSGFDMSHYNLGTLKCGTLVPVLSEPLAPGDRVSLGVLSQLDLPPLATNFYGRVDFRMEAFFVPYRIILQQWKKFMTYKNNQWDSSDVSSLYKQLPHLLIPYDETGPGSLADYLGYKRPSFESQSGRYVDFPNPLPFLAYHKIYDDWYRDKILQRPVFTEEITSANTDYATMRLRSIPYVSIPCLENGGATYINASGSDINSSFNDGVKVWNLRQRNFHKDYFTSATPTPQAGDPAQLVFDTTSFGTVNEEEGTVSSTGTGSFTIAALRAANSLQKFIERNNLAGDEYADQIQANYGVRPSDAAINHALYLGSQSYNVYNRSIFQTGNGNVVASNVTQNPFKTLGSEYGKASSMGSGSIVDSFECTEFGVFMVFGSLVPHSFYATGSRRYLYANELSDFPIPLLASVGDQPIYQGELASDADSPLSKATFGYTGRYSEAKFHDDEVHGILRDGETLEHFAIQRSFEAANVQLGTNFIQIPTTMLDQVMASSVGLSEFSAWYQLYFELHKSSLLPVYSVPTLGDEPDTHTELIDKGGRRL